MQWEGAVVAEAADLASNDEGDEPRIELASQTSKSPAR